MSDEKRSGERAWGRHEWDFADDHRDDAVAARELAAGSGEAAAGESERAEDPTDERGASGELPPEAKEQDGRADAVSARRCPREHARARDGPSRREEADGLRTPTRL